MNSGHFDLEATAMRLPRVRLTVRQMMAAVVIVAVGCAALPWLLLVPVESLIIVAGMAAIAGIATRGRKRLLCIRGALSLACLSLLTAAARESIAMWQAAAIYRRLAEKHANHHGLLITNIPYFDRHPGKLAGPVPWGTTWQQWVRYAEYDARLSVKYDRSARYPWLGVEPEPHPEPGRPVGYDPLWQ